MRKKQTQLTRRDFIQRTSKGTLAVVGASLLANAKIGLTAPQTKSRVVVVKDEQAVANQRQINTNIVQIMTDAGIQELTGIHNVGAAWKTIFPEIDANKTISIKVNCINRRLSSHPEVAAAIVNGLTQMQFDGKFFPAENIIIWDRTSGELSAAGYTINRSENGVKCYGTDGNYTSERFNVNGSQQKISKILTDQTDYLINLCVLKNHGTAGVTLGFKNHYGTCNRPGALHGSSCNPYLLDLNALAPIRDKQVLTICDALFGIISGGPSGNPQVVPKQLVFSQDPVAHDAVTTKMLKDLGCYTTGKSTFTAQAARSPYNLGTNDAGQMEVIVIENASSHVKSASTEVVDHFHLYQNYPNPFNAETIIKYQLKQRTEIQLTVFDIRGTRVKTLVNHTQSAGYHHTKWNGTDNTNQPVASGFYFAQLKARGLQQTRRMQLIK